MQVVEQVPCVVLNGISWDGYLQIDEVLGEGGGARLRFANDQLEIMSPTSNQHEYIKKNISAMILSYCRAKKIPGRFRGNATIRKEGMRGGEPDESFIFTEGKDSIDLAVEVALTSGGIDKLDFYRPLAIPEVWIYENEELLVFQYVDDKYRESEKSALLPDLDIKLVERLATQDYFNQMLDEFEASI